MALYSKLNYNNNSYVAGEEQMDPEIDSGKTVQLGMRCGRSTVL